jgi:hypothetical protein
MWAVTKEVFHWFFFFSLLTVGIRLHPDLNALLLAHTVLLRTWDTVSLVVEVRHGRHSSWNALKGALSSSYINVVSYSCLKSGTILISEYSTSWHMSLYQRLRFVSRFIIEAKFVLELAYFFSKGLHCKFWAKIYILCVRKGKACREFIKLGEIILSVPPLRWMSHIWEMVLIWWAWSLAMQAE